MVMQNHDQTSDHLVSIVSDSSVLSAGVAPLLGERLDLRLAANYAGLPPDEAAPGWAHHTVLIDGRIGVAAILRWIRYWQTPLPRPRVIVMDMVEDAELILSCIEAGAIGFTLLGATVDDLVDSVRASHDQAAYCPPLITMQVFTRLATLASQPAAPNRRDSLTPRELEVLALVNRDFSNQQIAEALVIELSTVKHHVHNILEKMQVRNRWDAARVATTIGWIPAGDVEL